MHAQRGREAQALRGGGAEIPWEDPEGDADLMAGDLQTTEAGFLNTARWLWRMWVAMQLIEEGGEAVEAWPQIGPGEGEVNRFLPAQPEPAGPPPVGSAEWLEELDWLETEGLGPFRDRSYLCR